LQNLIGGDAAKFVVGVEKAVVINLKIEFVYMFS